MKNIKGFTLIELIVVIVIISVLAAVALPRFTSLQREARIAKLNAARGAVAAAATIAHATLLARNGLADTTACAGGSAYADNKTNVCTEPGIVNVVNNYPAVTAIGTTAGILSIAGLTVTFNPSLAQLQTDGYSYVKNNGDATFEVLGGTSSADCKFVYSQALANASPVISGVETSGC